MRQSKFENDQKSQAVKPCDIDLPETKADDAKLPTRERRTPRNAGRTNDRRGYISRDRHRMHPDSNRGRQSYEDRYTTLNTKRAKILHHISKGDMSNKLR